MTDMLHVVGPIVFILLFTSGNVERSIWLFLNTADTLRALKVVRANGRVIGVRTRRKNLREALVCWISFVVAQAISWVTDRVLGWFPFYRSIKTLAVLVCAYWRLESSALFYQIFVMPLFKQHEKQIDLTLSLLQVTFGILYHLTIELPQAFISSVLRPWSLWPSKGDIRDVPRPSPRPSPGPSPKKNVIQASSATKAIARRPVSGKLPEWPPPKRSVFSEDSAAARKPTSVAARKPSVTKSTARQLKPHTSLGRPTAEALPTETPAARRRHVSGVSRVVSGGDPQTAAVTKPARGGRVAKTAAKLRSLPHPPDGDLDDSSGSVSSAATLQPQVQTSTHEKPHGETDNTRVSPKKRVRDDDEAATLPLKRRASRKAGPVTRNVDAKDDDAKRSAANGKAVSATATQRASTATARPKAGAASSSATGKRGRLVDKGGDGAPPKRVRSTRSTTGKRTTS